MTRKAAIDAVRSGMTIAKAAARFGVSRATLYRWLRAFEPDRPIASTRPHKRGPKGPRWGADTIDAVINIIKDHPNWWGRRRVAAALADRGIVASERTVGNILNIARERLAGEQRARRARNSRRAAAMARRKQRDAERRDMVIRHLNEILVPGVDAKEAISKIYEAFAAKGWKFQTKDLTPELAKFADAYLQAVRANSATYLDDNEGWLLETGRWRDQDHARVAAINHFSKRMRRQRASAEEPADLAIAEYVQKKIGNA